MRRNWPLLALALTFIMPFAAAVALLSFGDLNKFTTTQHGNFIDLPVAHFDVLTDFNGNQIENASKWKIVSICLDKQSLQLQQLKNLHTALGKERERVLLASSNQFPSGIKSDATLVIINPIGQAVMSYTAQHNLSGVLKDLRRLLKYSHAT